MSFLVSPHPNVDGLSKRLRDNDMGCKLNGYYAGCLLYADDLLLISFSVTAMQVMLDICTLFANDFDIVFNNKKSSIIRIGKRHNCVCEELYIDNKVLDFASECKYLGLTILAGKRFKCCYNNMTKFFLGVSITFIPNVMAGCVKLL